MRHNNLTNACFKSSVPLEDSILKQYWCVKHCFLEIMAASRNRILTGCTGWTSYPAVVHGWVGWMGSIHVSTIGVGIHLAPSMLIKASKSRRSNIVKTLLGRGRLCDVCDAFWTVYGEAVETHLLVYFVFKNWQDMLNG